MGALWEGLPVLGLLRCGAKCCPPLSGVGCPELSLHGALVAMAKGGQLLLHLPPQVQQVMDMAPLNNSAASSPGGAATACKESIRFRLGISWQCEGCRAVSGCPAVSLLSLGVPGTAVWPLRGGPGTMAVLCLMSLLVLL